MGRFIIVDTEKAKFISRYGEGSVPVTTISTDAILSEEETEAVFEDVFMAGGSYRVEMADSKAKVTYKTWDEFKKTL